jgi:hypothetical protein
MESLYEDNLVTLYVSCVTVTPTCLVYPQPLRKHNIILNILRTSTEVRVAAPLLYSQVKTKFLAFFAHTGFLEIVSKNN